MSRFREAALVAPVWVALALVLAIALGITIGEPRGNVRDLHGTWAATVEDGARRWPAEVELPGMFNRQGIPVDAIVVATRSVTVDTTQPLALWIDTPYYAAQVQWDGLPVGQSGAPRRAGPGTRTTHSVLALLPPEEPGTTHEIAIELRGDYGSGGVAGRILYGPASDVIGIATTQETQRLALALGLSLIAFLPLAVAAARPGRRAYVYFGLFATCLALLSFAQSDTAVSLTATADPFIRLKRLAEGPIAPLVIAFTATFVYGTLDRWHRAFLAFGAINAAIGLLAPRGALYAIETIQDVSIAASVPWYAALLVQGIRRGVRGSGALLGITLVPVTLAALSEIALTHGLREGVSYLYQACLVFVGGAGAALVLRDALASSRHERLLNSSIDAMVCVYPAGRIIDANPAAVALLGPCLGSNLLEYVDAGDHPLVRAHMQRGVADSDRAEFRLRVAAGAEMESLATPLDESTTLLVLRDVTQRRNIERGLIHAARMETVGLLLGGIAHDFNNMLGTLLAHVGALGISADPRAQERLTRMEAIIDRASQLTRRLLTIARGSAAELGPVDLEAICRSAVELVEPTFPTGIRLVLDVPSSVPPVHGDASDLEQLLVNLLVNARDALAETGGRVRLGVRAFALQDGSQGVCAMVEDDGPGVPADLRTEIFQPFVTTKGRGTGLGLAVASQVARDHHGRIWYEDRPGGGARFLLALRHADTVDAAPAPLPDRRRVLLVEDERVLLEDYGSALGAAGYEVMAMDDPTEAASWLLDNAPDILVTDVVMTGMSGLELAALCSARHPETPVLLVSGFIPDETLMRSTWHRLHKPVRAARLVSTVGSLRRRAERAETGDLDITKVTWLFPTLGELTAAGVGFKDGPAAQPDGQPIA